jgi:hypothetical protein
MKLRAEFLLIACLVPALSSCGVAIRYGSFSPPGLEIASGVTFAWDDATDTNTGDPRLAGNRFFEERLHEAVEYQLSLRGVRYSATSPTFVVHHHLTLVDHEMAQEVIDASGYKTTEITTSEQGMVVVHLEDAKTGSYAWLGWAQADIDSALRGPEEMRKWVYELTLNMFKSWPLPARVVQQ